MNLRILIFMTILFGVYGSEELILRAREKDFELPICSKGIDKLGET